MMFNIFLANMKLYKNFLYSLAGLIAVFKSEFSFKIEVFCMPFVLSFVYYCCSAIEGLLVISLYFLILSVELLNSGIEKMCDLITTDYNTNIKYIKDAGSAAVFILVCALIIVCMSIIKC